jgi:hypothetical protein
MKVEEEDVEEEEEEEEGSLPCMLYDPWGIGCSLAGGNWKRYYSMIVNFSNQLTIVSL